MAGSGFKKESGIEKRGEKVVDFFDKLECLGGEPWDCRCRAKRKEEDLRS